MNNILKTGGSITMLDILLGAQQKGYMPYNVVGKNYQGQNVETLVSAAAKLHWSKYPRWLTFIQAKELGYKVKKGEHGTQFEKWKFDEIENESTDCKKKTKTRALRRFYTVFHASQVESIPAFTNQK